MKTNKTDIGIFFYYFDITNTPFAGYVCFKNNRYTWDEINFKKTIKILNKHIEDKYQNYIDIVIEINNYLNQKFRINSELSKVFDWLTTDRYTIFESYDTNYESLILIQELKWDSDFWKFYKNSAKLANWTHPKVRNIPE